MSAADDGYCEVHHGSAELRNLAFTVEDASYSCPDGPSTSLGEPGKTTCWKGGADNGWVLLRLHEKALLSFVRVRNRSTSEISISISVMGKRRRDFVQVKRAIRLAHGVATDVKIGHLPCFFVWVECSRRRGAVGGVSLHELVPVGIPARCVGLFMGPCMEDLTYRSTERLLFGPSLKMSLAPVCSPAALARLVLPPSFLRATGGFANPNDPDPVRKGPIAGGRADELLHRHPLLPPSLPPGFGVGAGGRGRALGRPHSSFPDAAAAAAAAAATAAAGISSGGQFFRKGSRRGLPSGVGRRVRGGVGEVATLDEESSHPSLAYSRGGEGMGVSGGDGGDSVGGIAYPHEGTTASAGRHGHQDYIGHPRVSVAEAATAGADATPASVGTNLRGTQRETDGRVTPLPHQQYNSSGGSGGSRAFGARTGGGNAKSSASSAAASAVVRPFPLRRWNGELVDRNIIPNAARRREETENERKPGFRPEFGSDFGFNNGVNSHYPLGRYSEGETNLSDRSGYSREK